MTWGPRALLALALVACTAPPAAPAPKAAPALAVPVIAASSARPAAPVPRPVPPVQKLAASPGHTCALLVSGEIACWGGGIGPVKDGYRTPRKRPYIVPGIRDAVDVAAGIYHTCAARSDGTVVCWGWDSDGELGGERPEVDDELVVVPKLENIVEVASRASHTCARRRDGHVFCWGKNDEGQLGRPPARDKYGTTRVHGAVEVPGLTDAVQLVTSHTRSCARRATGRVVCWGAPLPDAPRVASGGLQAFPEVTDAVGIAADSATCVLRASGDALCFGGMANATPVFRRALAAKDVTGLAIGGAHECALQRNGSVVCWGQNLSGELGDGTTVRHDEAAPVVGLTDATQIVTSWNHVCALRKNREVVCWGANNEGQLGIGTDDIEPPFLVPGVTATRIAVGPNQSCAIGEGNKVTCWGAGAPHLGPAPEIALGRYHGCALTTTGGAVCWEGIADNAVHPIAGVTDAVAITAGEKHTCVRRKDGTAACWGQNRDGQLGDGTNRPSLTAVPVKGLTDAVEVRCGDDHTCALRTNGDIMCWGANRMGQAGVFEASGEPSPSPSSPVVVTTAHGARAIATGGQDTCALVGGKVTCWGASHHGDITCYHPGGCRGPRHIDVPRIDDALAIAAGGKQVCALRANATKATCWSKIDTRTDDLREVPLDAVPTSLAVAHEHVCAITGTSVRCWGRNGAGEVGAPPPYRTTPVAPLW